jgi:two-component system KDP operon response regulator KdpE
MASQIETKQSQSIQAAVATVEEGLFVVGPNGNVSYCNSQLEEMVGVKSADVVGHPYDILLKEIAALSSNQDRTELDLRKAVHNLEEQPTNISLQARERDNRLQVKLFPIHSVSGNDQTAQMGWGGIVIDATPEWSEVTQWAEHLSLLTHSMRASVATTKGFITTLLSGHRYWEENERQGFLESIDEHIDQLSRLLDNAQELFKLEVDSIELDRRPTDIKRLLQRVIQSMTFQKRGIGVQLEVADSLPSIEVDPLRIEQVMHNLLDSATKNSPRDKKIRMMAVQKDGHIVISVADQGMALSKEQLDHLFDGVFQANYGTTDQVRGLGVGLYVARGLALAHGGKIWAENLAGQGMVIHCSLPIEAKPMAAMPPQKRLSFQMQNTTSLETPPQRDVAKIMVVDDDPQMLRLLKIKLEVEGFQTITAARGNAALDLAAAEQPDLILLDVSLPDSSGFDVCTRLREFTAAPIIIITGQSREEDMVRGLDLGADDYLIKPIRNKELLARVRANLRRARVPDQISSKPVFRTGELMIDFAQRHVTVGKRSVRLTPTEYKLLYHLAANAGRILTHSQILSKVWGPGYEEDTQYLWVNISRLRGKIEDNPSEPQYILTEPGVGYYLPDKTK